LCGLADNIAAKHPIDLLAGCMLAIAGARFTGGFAIGYFAIWGQGQAQILRDLIEKRGQPTQ
jgi:hypothetical protein